MYCGGGGGGANKQEPLTCRGFPEGNSPPENFEILKLGNATFSFCWFSLFMLYEFFSSIFFFMGSPPSSAVHEKRCTSVYHWVSRGCCVDKRSSCLYSTVAVYISVVPNIVKAPTSH